MTPHSIEAEQALLGAILTSAENLENAAELLLPDHFFEPLHGRIFQAALTLSKKNIPVSRVTVRIYFEDDEAMSHVGGPNYLARLEALAVTVFDSFKYAKVIYDLSIRRGLIAYAERLKGLAQDPSPSDNTNDLLTKAESGFAEFQVNAKTGGTALVHISEAVDTAVSYVTIATETPGYMSGVPTGLNSLDVATRGLQPGELILLAARPSMGKTALAGTIAINAALRGDAVAFYSQEMMASQIATRMISDLLHRDGIHVPYHDALSGRISGYNLARFQDTGQKLNDLPIYIDEGSGKTISAMRSGVKALLRRVPNVKLLIIDHLGLIRSDFRDQGRVLELGQITQALKAIAKDMSIPVLLLAQLSRASEARDDKRPMISDLRASGEIEENADLVSFLYREAYYAERAARALKSKSIEEEADAFAILAGIKNKAELIIAKNRNGPTETIDLFCQIECSAFRDSNAGGEYGI